jgi:acetyl-CoA carboxylase carboxyl transferase subunit alpha
MKIIDGIIPEPAGGAHSDHGAATQAVGDYIERSLNQLSGMNVEAMLDARYNKFRRIAQFYRAVGATA